MNTTELDQLSEQELYVLCFMAYYMQSVDSTTIKNLQFSTKRELPANGKLLEDLMKKGWITNANTWGYSSRYVVASRWIVKLLFKLQAEYPTWQKAFDKHLGKRDPNNEFRKNILCHLNTAIEGKKPLLFPTEQEMNYLASIIMPHMMDCEFDTLINSLSLPVFCKTVSNLVPDFINNDRGTDLERIIELVCNRKLSFKDYPNMQHLLQLGFYMQTGHRDSRLHTRGSSPYLYMLEGIEAIERGDYRQSHRCFEQAKAGNYIPGLRFGSNSHDWLDFPLLNLFDAMAMYLTQDNALLSELAQKTKWKIEQRDAKTLPPSIFARFIDNTFVEIPVKPIAYLFDESITSGWICQKIGNMFCQWQQIVSSDVKEYTQSKTFVEPANIHYFAFATRLADSLLQNIHIKPQWEKALEMIITSEENLKARPVDTLSDKERSRKISYFLSPDGSIEIKEQTRLKNGNWSSGKKLSESNYYYNCDNIMDEWDLKVKPVLKRQYDRCTYHLLLPLLEGSRKVWYGSSAPYTQCLVREDKPYLSTSRAKGYITCCCNIPENQLADNQEEHLLFSVEETGTLTPVVTPKGYQPPKEGILSFYRIPVRVRKYLLALVRIGRFPLEAEPQLIQMFERIKGLIEIHSDMIEGGSTLPQLEGKSDIVIQAMPLNDTYQVRAIVRPMPEGTKTVVPGRGDNHVFDSDKEGKRYQVVRNKKQEKQNATPLAEFMEQADIEESQPYTWQLDPYEMLELMEWIPEQGDDYSLEWPEGKKIQLTATEPSQWNIALKEKGGWFEVEGEIPIDDEKILGIGELLSLMNEGHGRFIRLAEGQYLRLTDSLRRQLNRIDAVAQSYRGKTRIPMIGAGLIADYLEGEVSIGHPEKIDQLKQRIKESQEMAFDVPDQLNATLRDYQTEGYQWMSRLSNWGAGACLADDMGLGKTIQTITFLLQKQGEGASLVVAPASVVPNWKKEMGRFAPSLQVTVLNELAADDRKRAVAQATAGHVILSTYGLLISEEESVIAKAWNIVCLDEAHSIKNSTTKSSAVCMQLQAAHRLILTGTPIQNHLGELWNLFQFINPGLLGSYEQFQKKYINPIEGAHDKERQKQLKRLIQPFMLRRTKQEVVTELPDKLEITLPVQLDEEELAIYEHIRQEAKKQLEEDALHANGAASVNALSMITKLRMASCAASLAEKKWTGPSSKLETFCDLVAEINTSGNHVLVFSQFTSFLEMAKKQLEKRGIADYLYLDGSTTLKKRTQMVEDFQAGKAQIFLISLKAGGLGLNLTHANYVIHLDPWWNPAIEQQATDRAYRIGQQQKVTVYHLISEHTIEEKIVRLHQTKRDLADSLLEGTDISHKLNANDLLQMLEENATE